MLTAIFDSIGTLIGSIFGFVSNILEFAFSLPLWFILTSNAIGVIGIVAIVYLLVQKKNKPKATPGNLEHANKSGDADGKTEKLGDSLIN